MRERADASFACKRSCHWVLPTAGVVRDVPVRSTLWSCRARCFPTLGQCFAAAVSVDVPSIVCSVSTLQYKHAFYPPIFSPLTQV